MLNRFKIRQKLLLIFLLIGILPALSIGVISIWESNKALSSQAFSQLESLREIKKVQIESFIGERRSDMRVLLHMVSNLRQNAWQKLSSVQENKAAQIEDYFRSRISDIKILSRTEAVAQAIEQFSEAFELDGGSPGMAWESIKGLLDKELQHYRETLNYQDLLLIDKNGMVVYNTMQGEDLGTDLLNGELASSPFGQGVQQVLKTPDVLLQDFAPYHYAGNEQVMFVLGPVWRFEKLVGILAFRLSSDRLNEIVARRKGMGHSGDSYLVGQAATDTQTAITYRSLHQITGSTEIAKIGVPVSGQDADKALAGEIGLLLKYNEAGALVLSAYAPLNIPGLSWGLISSMEIEEILTPKLTGEDNDFFSKYVEEYDFYDLFLIHPQGKIFYSVKREEEYNTNVLTDEQYAGSELRSAITDTLKKRDFVLSDYSPHVHNTTDIDPTAVMAQPLLDADGNIELIVAVQLTAKELNSIMQQRAGMGVTGETYLVGDNNLLRSDTFRAPEMFSLENSFREPDETRINTVSVKQALRGETGRLEGDNYLGDNVLSAYMPIQVGDQTWALIAEVDTTEALGFIIRLEVQMAMIALVFLVLIWFFSRGFTNGLVRPLSLVNDHLKLLAQGELVAQDIEYSGRDEIAELVSSAWRLKAGMESTIAQANAVAAGDYSRQMQLLSDNDQLGKALSDMTFMLRQMTESNTAEDWLKSGLGQLNEKMRGTQDISTLAKNVIEFLSKYFNAQVGLFYVTSQDNVLKLTGSYAYQRRKTLSNEFKVGEGLIGQAALEREIIVIDEVPEDYIHVQSGTGHSVPRNIVVAPVFYENQLKAVLEMGSFHAFTEQQIEFLHQATPIIGIGVYTADSRTRLEELLAQSQSQAEELQSQAEELEVQQEELRQSNEELAERTHELERQQTAIREKNSELEQAKTVVEQKAEELALASKYKSEFLANMSHELRTPLNSLLILAQMLANNKDGNLTEKQVEYAKTMHHAGSDLLNLINEILDLSKIEAGKIDLHGEETDLRNLFKVMDQRFRHMAEDKGLNFEIHYADSLPNTIYNDSQRLQQLITNLLSNAFKFTPLDGLVKLTAERPLEHEVTNLGLTPQECIAIRVSDSGIGIPKDKQAAIFEAFQQADGSTARKYGGTGLGLSICRQLAQLMGGHILLESETNQGSTFSICVPERVNTASHSDEPASLAVPAPALKAPKAAPTVSPTAKPATTNAAPSVSAPQATETAKKTNLPLPIDEQIRNTKVEDDRNNLQDNDRIVLIIEDDPDFATVLRDTARDKHFKCVVALDGASGLSLVEQYHPHAVVLDIGLPQVDGLTVLERLKDNPETRHIPIHCMSGSEQDMDALKMGAIGYLLKPVGMEEMGDAFRRIEQFIDKKVKSLLLLADSKERQETLCKLVDSEGVDPIVAQNRDEAWEKLHASQFDCLVIDAGEKTDNRLELLPQLLDEDKLAHIPVVLYADRELTDAEEKLLRRCTEKMVIKPVRSPERLLDEATLFLHQVEAKLPQEQQTLLHRVHNKEAILQGKRVLMVDDDMRNIYSLTSILEEKGMEVEMAKNGKRALEILEEEPHLDVILMDIMMPEMDGYETMRRIRQLPRFKKTPMLALTAKSMKGDKAKCIEAGANDYLPKPIDPDKLLSLMRVWLYR